jgi:hypothetical protein
MDPNDPLAGIQPYEELSGLTGNEPIPPLEDPRQPPAMAPRSPLLTGLVLGLLLVVVSIALFQLLSGDDQSTPVAGGEDVAATEGDPATDDSAAADDSVPDTAAGAADDEPAQTALPYLAVGTPIAITDLTLQVDGVGDVKFGQPAADAVGRLVASLGEPDSDTGIQLSVAEWGVCQGENERIVTWGPFAAVVIVDPDGTETFAGYRLDFAFGGFSSDAANLATLSGVQAGASFRQLEQTYDGFDVRKVDTADLGPTWELYSSNTGALLLWGPLTEDETVRGIYAPDACGRF